MVSQAARELSQESWIDRASPYILLLSLVGIPAAGSAAVLLCLQIPRFIYGKPQLLALAGEIAGLGGLLILVPLLRAVLTLPRHRAASTATCWIFWR